MPIIVATSTGNSTSETISMIFDVGPKPNQMTNSGASGIQKFFRITLPLLSNTTFVVMILLVIEAFNMFESIFIMTAGGPLGSTSTMMYYIYEQAFSSYNMGYASALAWIFFALIMVVSLIQYKFRNEQGGE